MTVDILFHYYYHISKHLPSRADAILGLASIQSRNAFKAKSLVAADSRNSLAAICFKSSDNPNTYSSASVIPFVIIVISCWSVQQNGFVNAAKKCSNYTIEIIRLACTTPSAYTHYAVVDDLKIHIRYYAIIK